MLTAYFSQFGPNLLIASDCEMISGPSRAEHSGRLVTRATRFLVRIAKLLKEVVIYYERDNAEIISIFERPIIEVGSVATYLMTHGPEVMQDYRKCSYKDRLRILRDLESGSAFYNTKLGRRLLKSVREKMAIEGA